MSVHVINSATSRSGIKWPISVKKLIFIGLSVLILSAIGYAYYLFQKPHQGIADEKPVFKLNAVTLVNEYDANEKAANEKYLGKVVEVKGVISEKIIDEKGKFNITLMGQDLSGVGCEFDTKAQEEVQKLEEGQEVTIKGICTGVLMDVVLVDCVVSDNKN